MIKFFVKATSISTLIIFTLGCSNMSKPMPLQEFSDARQAIESAKKIATLENKVKIVRAEENLTRAEELFDKRNYEEARDKFNESRRESQEVLSDYNRDLEIKSR